MTVKVIGGAMSKDEQKIYADFIREKHPERIVNELTIQIDGEYVNLHYSYDVNTPFERIRRITGYLVGDMNRWNDGKRAEEHDRVKHEV